MRVLILDDREEQLRFLRSMLLSAGINCVGCTTVREAWSLLQSDEFSVFLVDYHLPVIGNNEYTASELIKKIRADGRQRNLPIIVITADRTYQPKINSLESGADYYLCKPVLKEELIICVRNMMARRYGHGGNVIAYGDISLRTLSREFFVKGVKIPLTKREYEVLLSLTLRCGEFVKKSAILREVYGEQSMHNASTNKYRMKIVDVWICKTRDKICKALGLDRNDRRGAYISTSWGLGYKITEYPLDHSIIQVDSSRSGAAVNEQSAESIYNLGDTRTVNSNDLIVSVNDTVQVDATENITSDIDINHEIEERVDF